MNVFHLFHYSSRALVPIHHAALLSLIVPNHLTNVLCWSGPRRSFDIGNSSTFAEFRPFDMQFLSVMEISHKGKEFLSIIQKVESDLCTLLNVLQEYFILFLQGSVTTEFTVELSNLYIPRHH